jgi:hypothetical protein
MKGSRDKNLKQNLEGRADAGAKEGCFLACSSRLAQPTFLELPGQQPRGSTAHRDLGSLLSVKKTLHRLTHTHTHTHTHTRLQGNWNITRISFGKGLGLGLLLSSFPASMEKMQ